jgi:hypothetical protein
LSFQSQHKAKQIVWRANIFVLCALPIAIGFAVLDNRETVKARSSSARPTVTQHAAIPSTKAPIHPRRADAA